MMKKFALCLLLLVSTLCTFAQKERLDQFWGLDYSLDKPAAEKFVTENNDRKAMGVVFGKTQVTVDLPEWSGEKFDFLLLDFYRNKMLAGYFSKKLKTNEEATLSFIKIKESLERKYGKSTTETSEIITCYWSDKKRNVVQLTMGKEGKGYLLGLLYLNGTLNSQKVLDEQSNIK